MNCANAFPRMRDLLGQKSPSRATIVGFPCDEGVRINGGRVGARRGPEEIRRAFERLTPDARLGEAFLELVRRTEHAGDIDCSGPIEQSQELLAQSVQHCLHKGSLPVVLGGGHEASYGVFLGFVRAGRQVSILNFDAHPDVRERKDGKPHSGSSFRDALLHESKLCLGYKVFGLQPHSVSAEHLQWMTSRGCSFTWAADLSNIVIAEAFQNLTHDTMVSFDIDVLDQSIAPGASAPAVGGLTSSQACEIAFHAGISPSVAAFDIVEVNPEYDPDSRTARMAALIVWHFLRGLCQRR